ncbi:hypothetical protein D3C85_783530 [compost metagenome]
MTDYNLSVSDLILVDGFGEAFASSDEQKIKEVLFQNGLDSSKEFEVIRVTHRNLRNQVVNGELYIGSERLDPEWIKSGFASLAARIEATDDASLRQTLRVMSVQRTQDKVFD